MVRPTAAFGSGMGVFEGGKFMAPSSSLSHVDDIFGMKSGMGSLGVVPPEFRAQVAGVVQQWDAMSARAKKLPADLRAIWFAKQADESVERRINQLRAGDFNEGRLNKVFADLQTLGSMLLSFEKQAGQPQVVTKTITQVVDKPVIPNEALLIGGLAVAGIVAILIFK